MDGLTLRESVITFDALSYCRNQDRGYVCDEKTGGAVGEGSICGCQSDEASLQEIMMV